MDLTKLTPIMQQLLPILITALLGWLCAYAKKAISTYADAATKWIETKTGMVISADTETKIKNLALQAVNYADEMANKELKASGTVQSGNEKLQTAISAFLDGLLNLQKTTTSPAIINAISTVNNSTAAAALIHSTLGEIRLNPKSQNAAPAAGALSATGISGESKNLTTSSPVPAQA